MPEFASLSTQVFAAVFGVHDDGFQIRIGGAAFSADHPAGQIVGEIGIDQKIGRASPSRSTPRFHRHPWCASPRPPTPETACRKRTRTPLDGEQMPQIASGSSGSFDVMSVQVLPSTV